MLTNECRERHNLVAASIAYRLSSLGDWVNRSPRYWSTRPFVEKAGDVRKTWHSGYACLPENTHGSLVSDRADLLVRAIETWNGTDVDNRTSAMRKKLVRLADNLLAAMLKEKKAFLDRTFLDQQSQSYIKEETGN